MWKKYKALAGAVLVGLGMMAGPMEQTVTAATAWRVVNDTVMGGVSQSSVEEQDGVLRFSGWLSLERNGGFVSTRRPITNDWSSARALKMSVLGDGRQYMATLRVSNRQMSRIYYRQTFDTVDGEWVDLELAFDDFQAYAYGTPVPSAPPLFMVANQLGSVGLMLADGNQGRFAIEVKDLAPVMDSGTTTLSDADTASLQQVFGVAISEGVPLFNGGQPARCADIYQSAVVTVLLLNPDTLAAEHRQLLTEAVRMAKRAESDSDRAWILRHAMDEAMGGG